MTSVELREYSCLPIYISQSRIITGLKLIYHSLDFTFATQVYPLYTIFQSTGNEHEGEIQVPRYVSYKVYRSIFEK